MTKDQLRKEIGLAVDVVMADRLCRILESVEKAEWETSRQNHKAASSGFYEVEFIEQNSIEYGKVFRQPFPTHIEALLEAKDLKAAGVKHVTVRQENE